MKQFSLDEVKDKSVKLWQLYSGNLEELAEVRQQLASLRSVLMDWSKGGKLDIETVGDFVVIFAVLYAKMYDSTYSVKDAPRQAYLDKFAPLDEQVAIKTPTPQSIYELFLKNETRDTFLIHFEVLYKDIVRWLSNTPISFAEVFYYLDIFAQLYELLALGKSSNQVGSVQMGGDLEGLVLKRSHT